jgi:hypothetical protein
MNPAAPPVLESVDTKWDRISAGKGAAEYLLPARTRPDLHYGGDRGADWLFVGFVLVRRLLLSAKCSGGHAALK